MSFLSGIDPIGRVTAGFGIDPLNLYAPDRNTAAVASARTAGKRAYDTANATRRINALFDAPSRQQQYGDLTDAVTQYYTDALNRQHDLAARNLKFSLARSGLIGGSTQADQNRRMGEDYTSGLLTAARQGQQAGQALKTQDEATREGLLREVNAGLDSTTGATNTALAMRQNVANAQNGATVNSLGDIFGNVAAIGQQRQQNQQYQQAFQQYLQSLFQPGAGP